MPTSRPARTRASVPRCPPAAMSPSASVTCCARSTATPRSAHPSQRPSAPGWPRSSPGPWAMRQYGGFGTAKESNARYHERVANGTGGLSVAFDLPTQMGYDSDEPIARGEVGKVGVAIDSLDDMRVLFDGLPLGEISTSMTINAPAATLLLLYQLVGEDQGVAGSKLTGTTQ